MTREEAINKLIRIRQLQGSKSEAHEALGMAIDALEEMPWITACAEVVEVEVSRGREKTIFVDEMNKWLESFRDGDKVIVQIRKKC